MYTLTIPKNTELEYSSVMKIENMTNVTQNDSQVRSFITEISL